MDRYEKNKNNQGYILFSFKLTKGKCFEDLKHRLKDSKEYFQQLLANESASFEYYTVRTNLNVMNFYEELF